MLYATCRRVQEQLVIIANIYIFLHNAKKMHDSLLLLLWDNFKERVAPNEHKKR